MRVPSTPSEKMYRALQHQLDAEYLDARRLYLEDIDERGKSPDALNMGTGTTLAIVNGPDTPTLFWAVTCTVSFSA